MDPEQLCKRLSRRDRGNRYWASRRVKIRVRSRNWPSSWKAAELPCVDCEVQRGKQLCRENSGVESWIKLDLRLTQCFRLFADFETRLLKCSIIGARKGERFVERQDLSTGGLCLCARRQHY